MSQETFELVKEMDVTNVETRLVLQCAPFISGLKISNLLIVSIKDEALIRIILQRAGISFFRLLRTEEKVTFLLFCRKRLEKFLAQDEVRAILLTQGYEDFSLGKILCAFRGRYVAYMKENGCFPHEMGLLLGYPPEDVWGFIKNGGRNFLYAGYWKVYEGVQKKIELFQRFDGAKEDMIQLLSKGVGMQEIIDSYKDNRLFEESLDIPEQAVV